MPDEMNITLTLEEKLQKVQGSLNAYVLATILYLKEHGMSLNAYWDFVGWRLARGWDQEMTAIELIKEEGAFLTSIGCNLRSLSGDETRAEAVVTLWPPDGDWTAENFLAFFGLSQEDADSFWDVYGPFASHLGLNYQWRRLGDEVTLTFTRREEDAR